MNECIGLLVTHSSYLLFLGKNTFLKYYKESIESNWVKFLIFFCGNSQLLQEHENFLGYKILFL